MSGRLPTLVPLDFDLERIAERARRRDMFAAAALTGQLSDPRGPLDVDLVASYAVQAADALLARLDATAGPASESVPLPPMRYDKLYGSESDPVRVTTSTGTQLIGRCVQRRGWDALWVTMDNGIIHGVIAWEPIPPSPATRPGEVERP